MQKQTVFVFLVILDALLPLSGSAQDYSYARHANRAGSSSTGAYNYQPRPVGYQSSPYATPELSSLSERIRSEFDVAMSHKEIERQNQLNAIDLQLRNSIAAVPEYYNGGSRSSRYRNPDYDSTVQQLRDEADQKRRVIESEYQTAVELIRNGETERLRGLNQVPEGFRSQLNSESGAVGLVNQNSNPYVRNYMNFPSKSEEDLYQKPVTPLTAAPAQTWQSVKHSNATRNSK